MFLYSTFAADSCIGMNTLTSKTINWLRMALVILVLFVHVHPDHNPHWLAMNRLAGQSVGWLIFSVVGTFINKLGFIAVPLFFTISGYLFFQKLEAWSWSVWKQKVRTRLRTLLVPYIIFNAICVISLLAIGMKVPWLGWLWNSVSYCQGWKNWLGMSMQLWYPQDVPLWFVRDLMVMVLLSPAIHWLIRKGGIVYMGIVGVLYCLGILCCTPGFSTNALFFFSLGGFAAIRGIEPVEWSGRNNRFLLPLFILLWVVASCIVEPGKAQPFENMMFIFGIPVLVWLASRGLEKGTLKEIPLLTASSFFVYAVHMVNWGRWSLLGSAGKFGSLVFNMDTPLGAACGYLAEIAYIIALGAGVYWLLEKIAPGLQRILTGGR